VGGRARGGAWPPRQSWTGQSWWDHGLVGVAVGILPMFVSTSPARRPPASEAWRPDGATRRGLAFVAPPSRSGRGADSLLTPARLLLHDTLLPLSCDVARSSPSPPSDKLEGAPSTGGRGAPPLPPPARTPPPRRPSPPLLLCTTVDPAGGANSCGACEGPAPLPTQGSPLHHRRTAEERDERVDPGTTTGRDAGGDPQRHP
jgi:hypothetical protein